MICQNVMTQNCEVVMEWYNILPWHENSNILTNIFMKSWQHCIKEKNRPPTKILWIFFLPYFRSWNPYHVEMWTIWNVIWWPWRFVTWTKRVEKSWKEVKCCDKDWTSFNARVHLSPEYTKENPRIFRQLANVVWFLNNFVILRHYILANQLLWLKDDFWTFQATFKHK